MFNCITYAYFWDYLRSKVNAIENNNIKQAFRDEIEKRIKIFRQNNKNPFNSFRPNRYNTFSIKKNLPRTGVEIKIGAIIYIMLLFPKICLVYDEKISLLDFRNKDLNELKDSILKLVNKVPEITSELLQQDMVTKGFTIQIKKIMQSNYPSRLNLDLKNINDENINRAFLELIDLIEIKKLVYLKITK